VKRLFLLTPEARSDLSDILLDIAEDSPAAAERLRLEIYRGFERLGQSPGIGHYHVELLDRRYPDFRTWGHMVVCFQRIDPLGLHYIFSATSSPEMAGVMIRGGGWTGSFSFSLCSRSACSASGSVWRGITSHRPSVVGNQTSNI